VRAQLHSHLDSISGKDTMIDDQMRKAPNKTVHSLPHTTPSRRDEETEDEIYRLEAENEQSNTID
jgi:guanylate kinase